MRVSIFTDSFLPFTSGVTFSVLNQAAELSKRGHEISIFRPKPSRRAKAEVEIPKGVQIFDVSLWHSSSASPATSADDAIDRFFTLSFEKNRPRHCSLEYGVGLWLGRFDRFVIVAEANGGNVSHIFRRPGLSEVIWSAELQVLAGNHVALQCFLFQHMSNGHQSK